MSSRPTWARPPPGRVTSPEPVPSFVPGAARAACLQQLLRCQHLHPPRAAELIPDRRPDDVDLLDRHAGGDGGHPCPQVSQIGRARCAPDPHHTRSVRAQPEGERWTFGPVADDVFATPEHTYAMLHLVREGLGPLWDRAAHFAAEGTPVGQGGRRLTTRKAPTRVGLDVRRFHPRRLQGDRPHPVGYLGQRDRMDERHGAVASLHLRRSGPECWNARCRHTVGGEPSASHHDIVARDLRYRSFELRPPLGQQRVDHACRTMRQSRAAVWRHTERGATGFDDGLPPGAATEVGQQRRLDGVRGSGAGSRSRGRPTA